MDCREPGQAWLDLTGVIETVFITGGSGLLALNWALLLRGRQPVTLALHDRQVALTGVGTHRCRLDSVDDVERALETVKPGIVIHTAALTSIETCEAKPELARHVNVDLAVNVALACARHAVPLAHISTDHLFSGEQACVGEEQPVAPRNVYGRTKAEAEHRVLDAHPRALVARTNFYAWGPGYRRSLSDTILRWLRGGETATLFTDVFFTPILADELARAVLDLAAAGSAGVYHVVGDERVSKHEFGMRLAAVFGLDAGLIRPALMAEAPARVRRPYDMSLANARARARLGRPMGGVDAHLLLLREQERSGRARELQTL